MEISYSMRRVLMTALPIRAMETCRIAFELRGAGAPLLVLQMGKVGSSSIYDGLRRYKGHRRPPVYHLHHIAPETIQAGEDFYRQRHTYIRHHLVVARILCNRYAGGRIPFSYIVTAVREPIGREISCFFENYPQTHPDLLRVPRADFGECALEVLRRHFVTQAEAVRDHGDNWFDREIRAPFGLDVFDAPYDVPKGYHPLQNDKARMALYKMEELDAHFSDGMVWLLNRHIPLGVRNIGSKKHYADAYRLVRARLRLDESLLRTLLSSRLVEHFYAAERESIVRKWAKTSP
jgi:hypothetical protein